MGGIVAAPPGVLAASAAFTVAFLWFGLHAVFSMFVESRPLGQQNGAAAFAGVPQARVDDVIARHAAVRQRVDHQWLHLSRRDDDEGVWRCLPGGTWEAVVPGND